MPECSGGLCPGCGVEREFTSMVAVQIDETTRVGIQAPLVSTLAILNLGHERVARSLCEMIHRAYHGTPDWRDRLAVVKEDPNLGKRLTEILRDAMGLRLGEAVSAPPLRTPGVEMLANGLLIS